MILRRNIHRRMEIWPRVGKYHASCLIVLEDKMVGMSLNGKENEVAATVGDGINGSKEL